MMIYIYVDSINNRTQQYKVLCEKPNLKDRTFQRLDEMINDELGAERSLNKYGHLLLTYRLEFYEIDTIQLTIVKSVDLSIQWVNDPTTTIKRERNTLFCCYDDKDDMTYYWNLYDVDLNQIIAKLMDEEKNPFPIPHKVQKNKPIY